MLGRGGGCDGGVFLLLFSVLVFIFPEKGSGDLFLFQSAMTVFKAALHKCPGFLLSVSLAVTASRV